MGKICSHLCDLPQFDHRDRIIDRCICKPLNQINMKKNVGTTDKYIRLIAAVAIIVVLATGTVAIGTTLGIILAVAGAIFLFTALTNWCAIYSLFGASTCAVEKSS
jgi:hypothetical protein